MSEEKVRRVLESLAERARLHTKIRLAKLAKAAGVGMRGGYVHLYDYIPEELAVNGREWLVFVGEGTKGKFLHLLPQEYAGVAEELGLKPLREHKVFVRKRLGKD